MNLHVRSLGSKIPFIWGHGLMGSMEIEDGMGIIDWSAIAEVAQIIRYDARGHGQSPPGLKPADYVWNSLAHDMLAVMDTFGGKQFIAGGHSMGCATALFAALAAPERIRGLILFAPPTAWETRAARAEYYDLLADTLDTQGISSLVEITRQRPPMPAWHLTACPELRNYFANSLWSRNPQIMATIFRGARLCDFPPRASLSAIKAPSLILGWTEDPVHPLETAEELNRLLPQSSLNVARNLEDLKSWTPLICDFIAALQKSSAT